MLKLWIWPLQDWLPRQVKSMNSECSSFFFSGILEDHWKAFGNRFLGGLPSMLMCLTSQVPNLYPKDEIVPLLDMIRTRAKKAGKDGSIAELYMYFIELCRTNLHMVMCMSPFGDNFRTRLRMFPSLVNCCTIDWFSEWPEEALRSVATNFVASVSWREILQLHTFIWSQRAQVRCFWTFVWEKSPDITFMLETIIKELYCQSHGSNQIHQFMHMFFWHLIVKVLDWNEIQRFWRAKVISADGYLDGVSTDWYWRESSRAS
jgi:hypothetical protein